MMERRHRPWMQYVLGWTAGGILLGITFVVATELEFYYILTAPFLESEAIGV